MGWPADAGLLLHYTSREAAQAIRSTGRIEAGAGGVIYLSEDAYEHGTQAADTLAIDGKPVDVVALVPASLLTPGPEVGVVLSIYDALGRLKRHGGGTQILIPGPLVSAEVRWLGLTPP